MSHQLSPFITRSGRAFPESSWFERPDSETYTPFTQTPPPETQQTAGCFSPDELFGLFTVEIIQANKVFIR